MKTPTLKNGFLTLNQKRYKECNPTEKNAFNNFFSDLKIEKMLQKATKPLLAHYQQVINELDEITPYFV